MASQSTKTSPAGEVPLTPKQEGKKVLEKGSVTPKEMDFQISIEKKLMSGAYELLNEMATDINGGTPSKEIEQIIFENMIKIMLKEFC